MNETQEHLKEDIRRLCHKNSNVEHQFIVHLYLFQRAEICSLIGIGPQNHLAFLNQIKLELLRVIIPLKYSTQWLTVQANMITEDGGFKDRL